MSEHSFQAPGFRVNKVKTTFQDAPDSFDYIALLKAIELLFRNQPVHVFPCSLVHEDSVFGEPGNICRCSVPLHPESTVAA